MGSSSEKTESKVRTIKKITSNTSLLKYDELIIANFLFDKFFWYWKIDFIKQKYS